MSKFVKKMLAVPVVVGLVTGVLVETAHSQSKEGDAIAIVNGKALSRARVVDLLMQSHGIAAMQQLIILDLAKQETARRGFKVQPSEVTEEFNRSLNQIAMAASGGEPIDEASKRKALDALLEQKGLSLPEFMVGMERNAHLRKIVESELKIDEAVLREEFSRAYGEKAVVRHIQIAVADAKTLSDVIEQLNQRRDFAELARQFSANPDTAAAGGALPPFSFDEPTIPAVLREAAFSMQPGEVSAPIRIDSWFHILRLEQRIAPEGVRFEDVRAAVQQRYADRVITQEMTRLAFELFRKAEIRVIDARLREKFEELRKNATPGPTP